MNGKLSLTNLTKKTQRRDNQIFIAPELFQAEFRLNLKLDAIYIWPWLPVSPSNFCGLSMSSHRVFCVLIQSAPSKVCATSVSQSELAKLRQLVAYSQLGKIYSGKGNLICCPKFLRFLAENKGWIVTLRWATMSGIKVVSKSPTNLCIIVNMFPLYTRR